MARSTTSPSAGIRPRDFASGLSSKGLSAGSIGLLGATVIGISCIAPAYTLTASLGPTTAAVGTQMSGIFLVGFLPMLLVALGYREPNIAMPDSGTSSPRWPARTMLAMGHYGAFPRRFATISPTFKSPGFATIIAAVVAWGVYAVMRVAAFPASGGFSICPAGVTTPPVCS